MMSPAPTTEEACVVSVKATNDPDEILRDPLHGIPTPLVEDSNKPVATSAIDKDVLRNLVGKKEALGSEHGKRPEDALRCMEIIVSKAGEARHAIDEIRTLASPDTLRRSQNNVASFTPPGTSGDPRGPRKRLCLAL
jgi:hypothetical protein